MKAMILAAGRGERMRPLTDSVPKPLLEVGGRPLIAYHLAALDAAGVREVVINHAWLGEQLVAGARACLPVGMQALFSDEGDQALETGGGILKALPLLGSAPFIVINGDIWSDYPIQQLPEHIDTQAHLVMVDNPPQHPQGDFSLQHGRLSTTISTPLTYSGIGVYTEALFSGCAGGAFRLAPLLRAAMAKGRISGEHYGGRWFDVGTPERLRELDAKLRS